MASDEWKEFRRRIWVGESGPFFDEVMRSYQSAQELLSHPDPRARLGAMLVIKDHWYPRPDIDDDRRKRPRPNLDPIYERLAFTDVTPKVRGAAMLYLGQWYYKTHDRHLSGLLARVVRDDNQPPENRYTAYLMLIQVNDLLSKFQPEPPSTRELWNPENVDWQLVDRFSEGEEIGRKPP